MSIGRRYTFWEFLQKNSIVIPIIQRDYAQGRKGKEILRKNFLESLKKALSSQNELVLDFVYGMTQKDGLIPLDGQQRLTTLWLLHWYVYLKKNSAKKYFQEKDYKVFNNFTYQTRVSSRQFCEELCKVENLEKLTKSTTIRKDILNQTWFLSEWEQDPTVKAMLNMLGGDNSIESIFKDCNFADLWDRLTNRDECPLFFFYLSIDGEILQEPDDIYIKMNARGEQLTDFENFKADLIKFVRDAQNKDEWSNIIEDNQLKHNPEIGLSKLIDKNWTDVFWANLDDNLKKDSENLPSIDKQFFAFLNRYFLNVILSSGNNVIPEKTMKEENVKDPKVRFFKYVYGKDGKGDVSFIYKDFNIYKNADVITPEIFKRIRTIFDVLNDKDKCAIIKENIKPKWNEKKDDDIVFLPLLVSSSIDEEKILQDIRQRHRVVFFGICCYLENCNDPQDFKGDSFKEWMRFVWNMARNSDIQTVDSMIGCIKKLKEVKDKSHSIITYLASQSELSSPNSYRDRQWNEEIVKAILFTNNRSSIEKAESAFHGSIRFLLDNNIILEQYIDKAKDLIQQTNNKDYLWITKILPYFDSDLFKKPDIQLLFSSDENDIVKTINNDNYNKDNFILKAVQRFFKEDRKNVPDDCWMVPLMYIDDNKNTIFNYSTSCRIRKYFISPKGKEKPSVYLYKGKQWKKDDCILLASDDSDLQNMIKIRNAFIKKQLKDKWKFCIQDDNLDNKKISPRDENKHYGRAIVLKKDDQLCYCTVDGYYDEISSDRKDY